MLRYVLLGLCLIPLLAQAEVACLEGPQGGKCHTVDVNGEVFKTAEPRSVTTVTAPSTDTSKQTAKKQRRINTQIATSNNKQLTNNNEARKNMPRRMSIAEQRIRQRSQTIESRFMRKQGINNLSQLNNTNDSYMKRKQQSAELRRRIETQQ